MFVQLRAASSIQLMIFLSLSISIISYYLNYTAESINNYAKVKTFPQSWLEHFKESLDNVVHQSQHLTKSYNNEVGKWRIYQYDNYALAYITDIFIPKFENLTNTARNITYPEDYKYVHDALVNSLKFETDSYRHFREYLLSGNTTEDEISTELFSRAFEYEQIYSKFLSSTPSTPTQNLTKLIGLD